MPNGSALHSSISSADVSEEESISPVSYTHLDVYKRQRLCRILGFLLFWMGVGLLISLMIRSSFLTVLAAALLLCVGYHLFCNTGE